MGVTAASPAPLVIEITRPHEGVLLFVLTGELDIYSAADFDRRIADLDGDLPAHVVIDLAGLTFVDSSGINALVQAVRSIETRGGTAVLAGPRPEARRVFEITGLPEVVPVEQDREAALSHRPSDGPDGLGNVTR